MVDNTSFNIKNIDDIISVSKATEIKKYMSKIDNG